MIKMDDRLKAPMILCFVGSILLFLESVTDIILKDFYEQEIFAIFESIIQIPIGQIWLVMGIVGIVLSLGLMALLLYMYKKGAGSGHFIAILVISLIGFVSSTAVFSLIFILIGSIIGIVATSKK